ncbi:MAG: DUF2807 domain-containing protein [Victivallales bacterium]|jgi:hypothetical protein|nr:DUF2807 domain-containing protein [Victivallales bacterium]
MSCNEIWLNPLLLCSIVILFVLLLLLFAKRQKEETIAALAAQPQKQEDEDATPSVKEDFQSLMEKVEEDIAADPNVREYPFSKLEYLSIAGAWQLHVQCHASKNSCRLGIEPKFSRFVKVEESRHGLLIRYTGKKTPVEAMTLEITTTGVPAQFKSIGKSRVWFDAVECEKFVCKITDGGEFEMPGAKLGELILKLTGGGRAECGGDFNTAEIEISDRSNAKLRGNVGTLSARLSGASKGEVIHVGAAEIAVSGGSKLKIEVTDKLEGDLSGGSSLKYRGEIDTSGIRISGSSKLKNWN